MTPWADRSMTYRASVTFLGFCVVAVHVGFGAYWCLLKVLGVMDPVAACASVVLAMVCGVVAVRSDGFVNIFDKLWQMVTALAWWIPS